MSDYIILRVEQCTWCAGLDADDILRQICKSCGGTGRMEIPAPFAEAFSDQFAGIAARLECAEARLREAAGQIDEMRAQLLDCQRRHQVLVDVTARTMDLLRDRSLDQERRLQALEDQEAMIQRGVDAFLLPPKESEVQARLTEAQAAAIEAALRKSYGHQPGEVSRLICFFCSALGPMAQGFEAAGEAARAVDWTQLRGCAYHACPDCADKARETNQKMEASQARRAGGAK